MRLYSVPHVCMHGMLPKPAFSDAYPIPLDLPAISFCVLQLLAPWSPYIMDTRDRPLTTKLTTQLTYPQSSSSNSPATDALDHPTPIKSFAQLRDDKTEFSYSSHTPRDNTTLKGGPAHIEVGGGIRASSISEAQAKVATRFTVTTMSQEIALLTQWVVDLERDVQQLTENIAEID